MTRWLAVLVVVLAVIGGFEARTIRMMKSEIETLRRERAAAQTPEARGTFTPEYRDEIQRTVAWLNEYYASPAGLDYPGGLCSGGKIDSVGLSTWVFGTYLPLRISGASEPMARQKVLEAIQAAVHGRPPA